MYDVVSTQKPQLSAPRGRANLNLVVPLNLRVNVDLCTPVNTGEPMTPRRAIELGHEFFQGLPAFLRQEPPINGSIAFNHVEPLSEGRYRLKVEAWGMRFTAHRIEDVGDMLGKVERVFIRMMDKWWDSGWSFHRQIDLVFESAKPPDWLVEGCERRKFRLTSAAHL